MTLPLRNAAKFGVAHFQKQIVAVANSSQAAKDMMKKVERMLKTTPTPDEFAFYGRDVSYSTEKAARLLGYEPKFTMNDALPLAAGWLKLHGFVEDDRG